jgi:hypothetical protein
MEEAIFKRQKQQWDGTHKPKQPVYVTMDAATKSRRAEQVRRRVTGLLAPLGFQRTKNSFWTRPRANVLEFLHLHLFKLTPAFRAHIGLRVINDPQPQPALNGPFTDETWREYDLRLTDSDDPKPCAEAIVRFFEEVGQPWIDQWPDEQALLEPSTPLDRQARDGLKSALAGIVKAEHVEITYQLLGRRGASGS